MDQSPFWRSLERLRASTRSHDEDAIEEILTELDTSFDTIATWPQGFIEGLEKLLKDSLFLSLANSWKLLYFINNNWEQLSDADRRRLKGSVIDTFDKHADWMGAFLSSEILGEHYPDDSTLSAFKRLAKTATLPARELVPHGIEYLAKSTQDESLRVKAVGELRELKQSSSEAMRKEATISLQKLGCA
jgi:hypothetical protein